MFFFEISKSTPRTLARVNFPQKKRIKGEGGVFEKIRKVPGYFCDDGSVGLVGWVGGGRGAQFWKGHRMFHEKSTLL